MVIKIIDPHLHLFDLSRGDYHWLKSENPPFWPDKSVIQRDFTIADLTASLNEVANNSTGIKSSTDTNKLELAGFVHIEAGFDNEQPWRELSYIEALLDESYDVPLDKPLRTIASIDLLSSPSEFESSLQKLKSYSSFVGVRHILDEEALTTLINNYAQQNFATLNNAKNLIFELQVPLSLKTDNEQLTSLLIQTIAKNSQLRFVINHAGFPPKDKNDEWLLWQENIAEIAKYTNVFIKCSGFEMTDRNYSMAWFSQVISYCISQFSMDRVMLASNFPLCLLSNKSYGEYWQSVLSSSALKQCRKNEKSALLYDNALRIYKI